jgi:hypothetical protein
LSEVRAPVEPSPQRFQVDAVELAAGARDVPMEPVYERLADLLPLTLGCVKGGGEAVE